MSEFSLLNIASIKELDIIETNKYLDLGVDVFISDLSKFDVDLIKSSYKYLIEAYLLDVSDGKFLDEHENSCYSPYLGMLVANILSKVIKFGLDNLDVIKHTLYTNTDKTVFKYISLKIIKGLHVAIQA